MVSASGLPSYSRSGADGAKVVTRRPNSGNGVVGMTTRVSR